MLQVQVHWWDGFVMFMCMCVCLHLLCRDDGGHQSVLQGLWWWNMAASLSAQVFLYLGQTKFSYN